jgi:cytochrome c-type biogenesis protein CcmH/NrfG
MAEKPKRLQQVLILLSTIAFVGSTGLGAVSLFTTNPQANIDQSKKVAEKSREEQLQVQIRGYESVLQREPENQAALVGLVQLRLEIKDLQGAIAPLEKLVKLNPNVESYKLLLAEVKKRSVSTEKPK